ncbi:RWD domain-containing protein 1 [Toxocara canis]|uniref:RWD domain-containing protein 1 n=1 Tax=Toxocara canis TaxID=6265 RepID=A0A0B2UZY9_TOXCA|nr:RWD domain-containing protein 1 [Toxocara canis]
MIKEVSVEEGERRGALILSAGMGALLRQECTACLGTLPSNVGRDVWQVALCFLTARIAYYDVRLRSPDSTTRVVSELTCFSSAGEIVSLLVGCERCEFPAALAGFCGNWLHLREIIAAESVWIIMAQEEAQAEELEALEAIYAGEIEFECRQYPNIAFRINLHSHSYSESEGRAAAEMRPQSFQVTLVLRLSAEYPDVIPDIELFGLDGLFTEERIQRVIRGLLTVAEENVGMPMAFTVVSALQESEGRAAAEMRPQSFQVTLVLRLSAEYPDVIPDIELFGLDGLFTEERIQRVIRGLLTVAEENVGMPMAFTVVSALQDHMCSLVEEKNMEKERDEEKKKEEEEALAKKKFEGTRVTTESFMAWKRKFDAEMRALKEKEIMELEGLDMEDSDKEA